MKAKQKQTILAILFIVIITGGSIYVLQNFATTVPEENQPQINIPTNTKPDDDEIITTDFVSEVIEDLSHLSPEERCKQMKDTDAQLNCYDNLVLKEVLASNILLACDDLTFAPNIQYCQDIFYKNKSLMDSDPEICDKIADEYLKNQCKDSATLRLSLKDGSLEECEKITNLEQRNNCIDNITLKSAIKNANTEQCDLLDDETLKELCKNKSSKKSNEQDYLQALETKNTALCSNLTDGQDKECEDAVNYSIALSNNTIATCTAIIDREKQLDCVNKISLNLAKAEQQPKYCSQIEDITIQTNCLREVNSLLLKTALSKNDSSLCKIISDQDLQDKCLSAI